VLQMQCRTGETRQEGMMSAPGDASPDEMTPRMR
jgi:hypothetical protein